MYVPHWITPSISTIENEIIFRTLTSQARMKEKEEVVWYEYICLDH